MEITTTTIAHWTEDEQQLFISIDGHVIAKLEIWKVAEALISGCNYEYGIDITRFATENHPDSYLPPRVRVIECGDQPATLTSELNIIGKVG